MKKLITLLCLIPVLASAQWTPPATAGGGTPAGSSGDIQTNGGSGAFSSINTSSGLKGAITDELAPDGASSKVLFALGGISVATGKTGTFSNTLTFTGTDGTSFSHPTTSGALLAADATSVISSTNILTGAITLYIKSQAITTSANPRDIVTITVPAGVTRWHITGNTTTAHPAVFVNETQTGTMAAGTLAAFDTAGGAGVQLLATTAPAATSSPTMTAWAASSTEIMSTSGSIFIRQMANAVNSGTISFYITIIPIP